LYEIATLLAAFPIYTEADINGFARIYFDPKASLFDVGLRNNSGN
jgi:hypothetical protein